MSNRRDGRKEETFGLLGFLFSQLLDLLSQLLGLLGSELFVQAPSPPLGLGDNLVTAFLDGGSLAGLLEMGYADILFDGMASLFEDGRTDWYVAALLLPNDVTKGTGCLVHFCSMTNEQESSSLGWHSRAGSVVHLGSVLR